MTDREDLERRVIAAHILNATPEDGSDLSAAKGIATGFLFSVVFIAALVLISYCVLGA